MARCGIHTTLGSKLLRYPVPVYLYVSVRRGSEILRVSASGRVHGTRNSSRVFPRHKVVVLGQRVKNQSCSFVPHYVHRRQDGTRRPPPDRRVALVLAGGGRVTLDVDDRFGFLVVGEAAVVQALLRCTELRQPEDAEGVVRGDAAGGGPRDRNTDFRYYGNVSFELKRCVQKYTF